MEKVIGFEYFYGKEAEQFAYIQVPRLIVRDPMFADLSGMSKFLFGLLLDRMKLSMKNGWFDSLGRAYIIYSIEEIMEELGIGKNKAIRLLQELDTEKGIGLIEKKKRGQGKPMLIYVKNFVTDKSQKFENETSELKNTEKASEVPVSVCEDADVVSETSVTSSEDTGVDNSSEKEVSEAEEFQKFTNQTSRSFKNKLLEVSKINPSKNNINNNNYNYISNPILSINNKTDSDSANDRIDRIGEAQEYLKLIRKNIDYDSLLELHEFDKSLIDGICDIILETVISDADSIVICGQHMPMEVVKSRFLKLKYSHIEYVMSCIRNNTTKINNIKRYLQTTLFNAPATMDSYYITKVNYDFYGKVE